MRTDRSSPSVPALVAWVAGLAATITVCSLLGDGPLSGPPLTRPAAWPTWLATNDPVLAATAVVRVAVLAACWYLAALTVVAAAGRAAGSVRAAAAVCAAAPAPARRFLVAALGAGVVVAAAVPSRPTVVRAGPVVLAAADAGPGPTRTLRRLDAPVAAPTLPTTSTTALTPPPAAASPTPLPAEPPAPAPGPPPNAPPPTTAPSAPDTAAAAPPAREPAPAGPRGGANGGEWVVRPGEHFWSIAEAHLRAAWGRQPALRHVGRYWRALVAANRDRLADPANPDLLFPGQRLRLPPAPDPGAAR